MKEFIAAFWKIDLLIEVKYLNGGIFRFGRAEHNKQTKTPDLEDSRFNFRCNNLPGSAFVVILTRLVDKQ